MTTTYRIAEVAARTGFSPPTLRYYEEIGLLPPAERGDNGYRVYGEAMLDRLRFVARAKQLGCSLEEIAELAHVWEDGHCGPVQQRLQAMIDAKVFEAQVRIAELTVLVADLQRAAAGLRAHTPDGPCDDDCGCVSTPASVRAPSPVASTGKPSAADDEEMRIACTLGAGERSDRLDEWKAVLDSVTGRQPLVDGLRLELEPTSDVTEVVRLAAAEQDCCRFFGFALVIDRRGVALEVRAPADGQAVLAGLFGAAE